MHTSVETQPEQAFFKKLVYHHFVDGKDELYFSLLDLGEARLPDLYQTILYKTMDKLFLVMNTQGMGIQVPWITKILIQFADSPYFSIRTPLPHEHVAGQQLNRPFFVLEDHTLYTPIGYLKAINQLMSNLRAGFTQPDFLYHISFLISGFEKPFSLINIIGMIGEVPIQTRVYQADQTLEKLSVISAAVKMWRQVRSTSGISGMNIVELEKVASENLVLGDTDSWIGLDDSFPQKVLGLNELSPSARAIFTRLQGLGQHYEPHWPMFSSYFELFKKFRFLLDPSREVSSIEALQKMDEFIKKNHPAIPGMNSVSMSCVHWANSANLLMFRQMPTPEQIRGFVMSPPRVEDYDDVVVQEDDPFFVHWNPYDAVYNDTNSVSRLPSLVISLMSTVKGVLNRVIAGITGREEQAQSSLPLKAQQSESIEIISVPDPKPLEQPPNFSEVKPEILPLTGEQQESVSQTDSRVMFVTPLNLNEAVNGGTALYVAARGFGFWKKSMGDLAEELNDKISMAQNREKESLEKNPWTSSVGTCDALFSDEDIINTKLKLTP